MVGTLSQIIYLGLSIDFMKSRKISMKKKNLPDFCHKIKTKTYIEMVRSKGMFLKGPENYKYVLSIVSEISWIKKKNYCLMIFSNI